MQRRPWRSALSAVIGIIAVASLVAGALGLWTLNVATDSDRFERRVGEILRDPQTSAALSEFVVDEIVAAINLEQLIDANVPSFLQGPIDLILSGLEKEVEDRLATYIASDEGSGLIAGAASIAHREIIAVLEGDGVVEGVTIDGDDVSVNLLPVIAFGLKEIQEIGVLTNLDIPDLERGGDPDEQRTQLSEALGVTLPDRFGTPVIYSSTRVSEATQLVQTAQDVLVLAKRAVWLLLIGGLLTAVLAVWLARRRILALVLITLGSISLFLAAQAAGERASSDALDLVRDGAGRDALEDILDGLLDNLSRTIGVYVAVLLIVVIVSIVAISRGSGDRSDARASDDGSIADRPPV
jgi:hypothetical protein